MSKRVKKQYTSNVTVIDFKDPAPTKKYRASPTPRNKTQELYVKKLLDPSIDIVFATGYAGTGKTLLAMQVGIKLFQEGKIDKIVVTRPAVGVDEDLGYLPGTLTEKMAPWTRPLFDVLSDYYSQKEIEGMLYEGVIEISPLAFMRGRTFHNSYIIFDESQNSTIQQMKMVLTRIGQGSKMAVTGDLSQADRKLGLNGLDEFLQLMQKTPTNRISLIEFTRNDIERHPVVNDVLKIYGDE